MPTLQITVSEPNAEIQVLQDIKAQPMTLIGMSIKWGLPEAGSPALQNGALVDLGELGASSRQITGYTKEYGPHSYLYLPRPGYMQNVDPNEALQFNELCKYYPLNLNFNCDDIRRSFVIRTMANSEDGGDTVFSATELQEYTLWFNYTEHDVHA